MSQHGEELHTISTNAELSSTISALLESIADRLKRIDKKDRERKALPRKKRYDIMCGARGSQLSGGQTTVSQVHESGSGLD